MRVWVAGARGLLGQAVVGQLVAQGRDHVATDRDVDLTDAAAVDAFAAAEPFTHVINCAAYTAVDRCETEEDLARQVNADAPGHLARAARARGAVLVHVSTDYVFAGDGHAPYREDDPTGPVSAYGRTKLLGEQRLFAAIGDGAGYVVRTSWLFGAGGPCFPATMLRLFGERPEVRVVDDQHGRPTYAPDLAAALIALAERRPAPGVYQFANAEPTTWFHLALATRAAAAALGRHFDVTVMPVPSAAFPTPAKRPAWSVLATDKLEAALGAAPPSWRPGLGALVAALLTT